MGAVGEIMAVAVAATAMTEGAENADFYRLLPQNHALVDKDKKNVKIFSAQHWVFKKEFTFAPTTAFPNKSPLIEK